MSSDFLSGPHDWRSAALRAGVRLLVLAFASGCSEVPVHKVLGEVACGSGVIVVTRVFRASDPERPALTTLGYQPGPSEIPLAVITESKPFDVKQVQCVAPGQVRIRVPCRALFVVQESSRSGVSLQCDPPAP
jgi:hypothetical protein